jgi:hypothetical protein
MAQEGGQINWKRTHLENLFRILPAGVTSKNDIGDLKMAVAILSCNFLDACNCPLGNDSTLVQDETYLDGTEDPQYQRLTNCQSRGSYTKSKVDTNVFSDLGVATSFGVMLRPVLEPNTATYVTIPSVVVLLGTGAYETRVWEEAA